MTRKRFIKLLMADGYSRNDANTLAADARSYGMMYSNAYNLEHKLAGAKLDLKKVNIDAMVDAIRNIVDVASQVATAIYKAVCAFAATYQAEMEGLQ